jgi:hypothetical protein
VVWPLGSIVVWLYPSLFTSGCLCLLVASGHLLKAARHFDTGFAWFNRTLNIEKKPVSAIGLVAGVVIAVAYWCFAVAFHFASGLTQTR